MSMAKTVQRGENGHMAIGSEIVAALVKSPRSVGDLTEMVGCTRQTVWRWLRQLQESRLVVKNGRQWSWAPFPEAQQ